MPERWHAASIAEAARRLESDPIRGLSTAEAERRLASDGPNELRRSAEISPIAIFLEQFRSLVIWVLIAAAFASVALGEVVDGSAILAIVALNAAIGFFQEFRAERAVAALARLAAPRARVVRDGASALVPAREIVRGDLLVLDAGDLVAADARLLEASELRVDEAPLTGESMPVSKHADEVSPESALADRLDLVFMGTSVAAGSGRALVVATGMQTEVGHIARLLESASSGATPLQKKLDVVARRLLWACLAIVLVVFALGLLRGSPPLEMFIGAVSLAVAAVPEGLPAVVTVALALGVQRMVRRHALVRRLPSVETLGATQVICTDKTGTLTVGAMTVRRLVTAEATFHVTGEGYTPVGRIDSETSESGAAAASLRDLLRAAAACNDAELSSRNGTVSITGDPTEAALLVVAAKAGIHREGLDAAEPRLRTLPFDSDRKRMSVIRRRNGRAWAYVKGAPETILERCTHVLSGGVTAPLDDSTRNRLHDACARLATDALRVLAIAERSLPTKGDVDVERDLVLLGLAAMQDPPRPEAREAVAKCRRAGILTVMITGDHPSTARAIAAELGILGGDDETLTGNELERMSDRELSERVERVRVYARVSAEHKLRIVRAWKGRNFVVAMTGDGVNDAPALREASIGIAMGITGTEVAKQASDMVITDDHFATIVAAVEEGRGILDNVSKTLAYLLAGNAGELILVLAATLAGYPLPLLPIQLLWINLITDGLPALALATDPIDPSVLDRPPRPPDAQLADRSTLARISFTGCLTAASALSVFAFEMANHGELATARNAAFSTLVFAELLRAFGARSETKMVHEIGILSNLRLLAIVAISSGLQVTIHHVPALEKIFGTQPITFAQCMSWLAVGSFPLVAVEVRKWAGRVRRGRRHHLA